MDDVRFQIFAYMNHHKMYNHKKDGCTDEGTYDLYKNQRGFLEMVHGIISNKRKLFHDKSTMKVKKYFPWTVFLIGMVMKVLESLVQMRGKTFQKISN